jgi:O-antigen ligase
MGLFLALLVTSLVLGQLYLLLLMPLVLILLAGLSRPVIFYFLLLAAVPLSMEYQFSTTLGTDLPDETLMWILSPVVLFLILRQRSLNLFSSPIVILILAALAWSLITVLFSDVPLMSVKFVLAKAWYILPFVFGTMLFLKDPQTRQLAAKFFLVPLVLASLVILARHGFAGFRFETVNDVTWPFFRNHVNYGALLACSIPLAFALYRLYRGPWALVLVILIVALVFSYSRGAWLALVAAVIMVFIMRRGWMKWMIAGVAVLTITTAAWLITDNRYLQFRPLYERTIYHSSFDEHMEATYNLQDLSTMERFYRWIAAVNMAEQNWITGYGPNSFYPTYKSFTVNEFRTYVSANPEKSTVHNYFLLLLTEQGLPGLLLFLILYTVLLLKAQQVYLRSDDPHLRSLALISGAILAMVFVLINLSDLIETDKIGSVFYICAGLLAGISLPRKS